MIEEFRPLRAVHSCVSKAESPRVFSPRVSRIEKKKRKSRDAVSILSHPQVHLPGLAALEPTICPFFSLDLPSSHNAEEADINFNVFVRTRVCVFGIAKNDKSRAERPREMCIRVRIRSQKGVKNFSTRVTSTSFPFKHIYICTR